MKIDSFKGDFAFLSNFAQCRFVHEGIVFVTNEHFYQSMKTLSVKERRRISLFQTAGETKREGRKLKIREDWESVKVDVMREGLRLKFFTGSILAQMLEATHPATLIEGNWWHDQFWGNCTCKKHPKPGKNMLGILLMERRAELM